MLPSWARFPTGGKEGKRTSGRWWACAATAMIHACAGLPSSPVVENSAAGPEREACLCARALRPRVPRPGSGMPESREGQGEGVVLKVSGPVTCLPSEVMGEGQLRSWVGEGPVRGKLMGGGDEEKIARDFSHCTNGVFRSPEFKFHPSPLQPRCSLCVHRLVSQRLHYLAGSL